MRTTINHNGVDVEIQLTPEQEALVIKQSKPKFEFNYVRDQTYYLSAINTNQVRGDSETSIEHGRYRKTKQAAEQSLARNKRTNRLEALAEQLGGIKEFVIGGANHCIFHNDYNWHNDKSYEKFHPERVYMTKECATEICRMLNEGEFSLNGELR